jgi:ribosomal protein S18 acetylase RimI-like enzyme
MPEVEIRELEARDVERLIEIEQAITRKPVDPRWRAMASRHVNHDDLVGFVAQTGREIVGFILGEIRVGAFGANLGGWIEIVDVVPDSWGRGIGDALCRHLCDYFDELGVERVFTSARWDAGDLLAFFKKQGFDRSPFINLQLSLKKGK